MGCGARSESNIDGQDEKDKSGLYFILPILSIHVRSLLIILLVCGTKSRQHRDIQNAQLLWQEYRRRKQ